MTGWRLHYAWIVLAVGTLVVAGSLGLARFGYTLVLPSMQASLGMDNTQAGALATSNLIGYLALSAVGGALASRFGPRAVITWGLAFAGAGMLLTGLAQGFASAALWRAVTGLGSGASNVPVMALMAAWFAARRRGLASGIAVAGSSVGLIVIGPLVPRVLAAYGDHGWRMTWYGFGGTTLLLALLAFALLRNHPGEKGLAPLGSTGPALAPDPKGQALHWGRVYGSGAVWHLGLVYVAFGFSYIIYVTFFGKYLIAEGGYTPAAAGQLFMLVGWLSLFCGLGWGAVSDVIGRRWALVIVYLIQATAFSVFALWPAPAGFTSSAVLFGLTAWSIPAIMAATCGDVVGPRLAPAALGFVTLLYGMGQATGPSVAGAMADASGSFGPAFLLAAGVALAGAAGAFLLRPSAGAQMEP